MSVEQDRIAYIAEYIARADELQKKVGNDPNIRPTLDANIDKAYMELKTLHPDPEGAIEDTWNNIAAEEGGIVNPLKDYTVDHEQFIKSQGSAQHSSNIPPEKTEGTEGQQAYRGDNVDAMVYSLMKNAVLTSKTPDAKKEPTTIFVGKDAAGTTHYGNNDEEIKKLMNQKVRI